MPNFSISSKRIIPRLQQEVKVSHGPGSLLECTGINRAANTPASASFSMPRIYFDSAARTALRGAYVEVYLAGSSSPEFGGYLDVENAQASASSEQVSFTATSATKWLDKVYVNQTRNRPELTYKIRDENRAYTGVTLAAIAQDFWGHMPPAYASRIVLGDISELEAHLPLMLPSQIVLRQATFRQALDTLCAYVGDLVWYETFTQGKVHINFYRIGAQSRGSYVARCANYGTPTQANIEAISLSTNTGDTVNRVQVFGDAKKFLVTAICPAYPYPGTEVFGAPDTEVPEVAALRLRRLWDTNLVGLFPPEGGAFGPPEERKVYERDVFEDPSIADPQAPNHIPGTEFYFKRFGLPKAIMDLPGLKLARDFTVWSTDSAGNRKIYEVQVFKWPTILEPDPLDATRLVGTVQPEPMLIKDVQLDLAKGTFMLTKFEDACNITSMKFTDSGAPEKTYAPAKIGITFALQSTPHILGDTGPVALDTIDLASDGLTYQTARTDLQFVQWTNAGYPIRHISTGEAELYWPAIIWNEELKSWNSVGPQDPVQTPIDDTPVAGYIAQQMLRSRAVIARELTVQIPYCDPGAQLGAVLVTQGFAGNIAGAFLINQISHDFVSNSTSITCDNTLPPSRFETAIGGAYDPTQRSQEK